MTRPTKTPARPRSPLAKARLRTENLRIAALAREERKAAMKEKVSADHRAKVARSKALGRIDYRISRGGFGARPATPAEEAVRTLIDDGFAAKMDW